MTGTAFAILAMFVLFVSTLPWILHKINKGILQLFVLHTEVHCLSAFAQNAWKIFAFACKWLLPSLLHFLLWKYQIYFILFPLYSFCLLVVLSMIGGYRCARVRKTSSAWKHCCPQSFCKNPEYCSFQFIISLSGESRNYPDTPETVRTAQKLSG